MEHRTMAELEAGLDHILESPRDEGTLDLVLRRPGENLREILTQAELDVEQGVIGDRWFQREDRSIDRQLNLMNTRAVELVAGDHGRWGLAGDQMYVDFDLSEENAPPGTRLGIGHGVVVEITPPVHAGCSKFKDRFGADALVFVNGPKYRHHRLRGVCAKVVIPGLVRPGDAVRKID